MMTGAVALLTVEKSSVCVCVAQQAGGPTNIYQIMDILISGHFFVSVVLRLLTFGVCGVNAYAKVQRFAALAVNSLEH